MKELNITAGEMEYTVWVGASAKDNWNIIGQSEGGDVWFHVEGLPSAHVILRHNGYYDEDILSKCAIICASSLKKQKQRKRIVVLSTDVANLTFGDKVGMVHITNTAIVVRIPVRS